jgi:hypothetical protein
MIIYIVHYVGGHCGHEVIDSIHLDKLEAQMKCHRANVEFGKYMGSFDGSQFVTEVVSKKIPYTSDDEDFDLDHCDVCGYDCKCTLKKCYKTEEAYKHYWREERKDHNQNHSVDTYGQTENCEFCKEDLERHKRLEQI